MSETNGNHNEKNYDMRIHNSPDAMAWTKFFMKTMKEKNWKIEDIDEALIHGWFANAMMAMHDSIYNKIEKDKKLKSYEAICGFCSWLSTRNQMTVMNTKTSIAPVAKLIQRFCNANKLDQPRIGWEKNLYHPEPSNKLGD